MGNGVSEEEQAVQVRNWRHSMAEDVSQTAALPCECKDSRGSVDSNVPLISSSRHLLEATGGTSPTSVTWQTEDSPLTVHR